MTESTPPTKAELAAANRAARKAKAEAQALRANLHRRKAQARAAQTSETPQDFPHPPQETPPSCR